MIGGVIDYAKLAQQHAPKTSPEMRQAVKELRARGLGDYEIASATSLSVEAVRRLLGSRDSEAAT